jgi:CelD/BcsL family acetyltransferase involved in cellulose biosynthesis
MPRASVHGTIESAFEVEWRPLAALAPIADAWRALAARALAPNVFYEPAFALAAEPVFGRDVGAGLVWSHGGTPRLLGLFPARLERHRYGLPWPVLVGWTHPYAPLGAPLVDREAAAPVIGAWLDHLAQRSRRRTLLLPMVPEGGPLSDAFAAALTRRGGASVAFAHHERALLAPPGDRADYVAHALPHKKLKELARQLRRLGDEGHVATGIVRDPSSIVAALGDFLALEAKGWKGRAGTAAQHDPAIRAFLEAAVPALAAEGKAEIARLSLDDHAIATLIVLRSRDAAWCWKIAYDESHARASPGVQLMLHMTKTLVGEAGLAGADSCAQPDHPMIDHLWRERLPIADRLIRIGPQGGAAFALTRALEAARRGAIAAARAARDLLRR